MRSSGPRGVAAVLAASVMLGACGQAPDQAGPATAPSPGDVSPPPGPPTDVAGVACDMLNPQDFETAFGERLDEGVPTAPHTCSWSGTPAAPSVALAVVPDVDPATCAQAGGEAASEVEGLAAEAWWEFVQAEVGVGMLLACPPGSMVSLTVTGPDEAMLRMAAEDLAARVLERLG